MNKSYSHCDSKGIPFDIKLDELFKNKNNGFFIELGAYDGIGQSNTAFFEFTRNWKGILIEPSYKNYIKCINNRPNSKVYNLCCVSDGYNQLTIKGDFNDNYMSSVNGTRLSTNNNLLIDVSVSTLEKVIDDYFNNNITETNYNIDFLSLDTEGYELSILKGLNINKYRPKYMLIEIYSIQYDEIVNFLKEHNYSLISNFSNYNKISNPYWDGTHNDYLFKDNNSDI